MHNDCICQDGVPCYHEAVVFAVGETRDRVLIDLMQCCGTLCRIHVRGFTSWRRVDGHGRPVRKHQRAEIIDRITRDEHALTIDCTRLHLVFFGTRVSLTDEPVGQVDHPRHLGYDIAERCRIEFGRHFRG